ncbi:MAG: hypothetical protein Q9P01_01685 [Anaerolineae bacterium]|nr:hypothetical protein [Anaerolineae bacterium]
MVHALNALMEARRVLAADGVLIVLHPIALQLPLEIMGAEQPLFAGLLDDIAGHERIENAHQALRQVVQEGWLTLERQEEFKYFSYWDTVDEMMVYHDEQNSDTRTPDHVLAKTRRLVADINHETRVRVHDTIFIGRYTIKLNNQ